MKTYKIYYKKSKKRSGSSSDPLYWSEIRDLDENYQGDHFGFNRTNEIDASGLTENTLYVYYDLLDGVKADGCDLGVFLGAYDTDLGTSMNPDITVYEDGTDVTETKNTTSNDLSNPPLTYAGSNLDKTLILDPENKQYLIKCAMDSSASKLRLMIKGTLPGPGPSPDPSSSSSSGDSSESSSSSVVDTRTVYYVVYAKTSRDMSYGGTEVSKGKYVSFGGTTYSQRPLRSTSILSGSSGYSTGTDGYQQISASDLTPGVYDIIGYAPSGGVEIYENGTYQCCYSYDINYDGTNENQGSLENFIEGFYVTYEVV